MNYIEELVHLMELIDREPIHGSSKKRQVIELFSKKVIGIYGEEHWMVVVKPMIPLLIDFIVGVSRKDIKLQINRARRCCLGRKKK